MVAELGESGIGYPTEALLQARERLDSLLTYYEPMPERLRRERESDRDFFIRKASETGEKSIAALIPIECREFNSLLNAFTRIGIRTENDLILLDSSEFDRLKKQGGLRGLEKKRKPIVLAMVDLIRAKAAAAEPQPAIR